MITVTLAEDDLPALITMLKRERAFAEENLGHYAGLFPDTDPLIQKEGNRVRVADLVLEQLRLYTRSQ